MILNTRTGEAEYCSAGHAPPLFRSGDGSLHFVDSKPGPVIGFDERFGCATGNMRLKPGDMVFLYTDGVTEAENSRQEQFSPDRLKASVSGSGSSVLREIVARVRQDIASHTQGHPQSDDITLLALKYNGSVQ
jgi:sigma-B regulation protein RsbU (phosphoserine phosphatase)